MPPWLKTCWVAIFLQPTANATNHFSKGIHRPARVMRDVRIDVRTIMRTLPGS